MNFLNSFFSIQEKNSTIKKEILAGLATFLAMSYIIIVNPKILSAAGMPSNALVTSTILIAAFSSIAMGLYANNPFAIGPGMGMNVFFSYTAVNIYHLPWQTALGATFWSGIIFILLVVFNIRTKIMMSMPKSVKMALGSGVGLFIAYIGFINSGMVNVNGAGLFTFSSLTYKTALFLICLVSLLILFIKKVPAPIIVTVILGYAIGMAFNGVSGHNVVDIPHHIFAMPDFSLLGQINFIQGMKFAIIPTIFTFLFLCLFDSTGTISGLYTSMGKSVENNPKEIKKIFMVDATSATVASIFGSSPATVFVESGVGVAQGGRTGLTAIIAGLLFLPFLFLSPLINSIPMDIIAPSLILIGILMMQQITGVEWNDMVQAIPAFFTILMMILSSTISIGIAFGMVVWLIISLTCNRKELNTTAVIVSILCFFMVLHGMNVF